MKVGVHAARPAMTSLRGHQPLALRPALPRAGVRRERLSHLVRLLMDEVPRQEVRPEMNRRQQQQALREINEHWYQ